MGPVSQLLTKLIDAKSSQGDKHRNNITHEHVVIQAQGEERLAIPEAHGNDCHYSDDTKCNRGSWWGHHKLYKLRK